MPGTLTLLGYRLRGRPQIDPNFFVGQSCEAWFQEAERIMAEAIRPAMDAARRAGRVVCHVEHPLIWARHPDGLDALDPPGPTLPEGPPEVVPGHRAKIVARSHGPDFETASPYARMDRTRVVAALPGKPLALQTSPFDRILRRRGIENLVYAGFAADMCILRAPGSTEPVAGSGAGSARCITPCRSWRCSESAWPKSTATAPAPCPDTPSTTA
ncbi:MAG: isochorismatase family protein [Armatimonadetes bacterium]|nr:isochorismatase family protein [Armatimonadota bacterium]